MMFFYSKIVDALKSGITTIEGLVEYSKGTFILEIFSALKRISKESDNIYSPIAQKILLGLSDNFNYDEYKKEIEKINYLPIPHILDSDWRFTSDTTRYLCDFLKSLLGPQSNLILIGVPSLFLLINENQELIDTATLLIERNNISQNTIKNPNIICGDIRDVRLYNCANVVLCDPPWYLDTTKYFMDAAQTMLRNEGILLMIVTPEGVRSTVIAEYDELIKYAQEGGLEFVKLYDCALNYVTPPFELNTLINAGITKFPIDWRRGSIMMFAKKHNTKCITSGFTETSKSEWLEVQVHNVRFKVRDKSDDKQLKPIVHLCENDIYPTVSMKLELKNDVNIWTSGNRVYKCRNPFLFRTALSLVQMHGFARNNIFSILNKTEETVAYLDLIENVVNAEEKEYAHFWSNL